MTVVLDPRAAWRVVGAAPNGRQVPGSVWVFLVGALVGAGASVYSVRSGINLDYGDSMAHLTIARRIFDNRSPGLQQLGTVWLPLPHLLLVPLVANLWLWHTGVAACILGATCLGATACATYRVMARLHYAAPGRVVALILVLSNLSLLYASTTALTEPVLIASIMCCLAGLGGWALADRRLSGGELAVFAGIPAAAGVLSRYEAWALVISGTIYVAIVVLRRGDGWRRAVTLCCSFAAPPVAAISWWLAYNTAWYRNPLEFLTGPYSAAAFTKVFIEQGLLTTKGNPGLSLRVYSVAVWETAGLVTLVLAALGLAAMTLRWGVNERALLVWLGGTSSAFLLVSLIGGQHIMVNDGSLPPGADYNNRYALSAIPWLALLAGFLFGKPVGRAGSSAARWSTRLQVLGVPVVALAMSAQVGWWLRDPDDRMTVIAEGSNGHRAFAEVKSVARWLGEHYDGGGILMDESADLAIAPVIGLPVREYYNRATGSHFERALADPPRYARWVLMHAHQLQHAGTHTGIDNVTAALVDDPQFYARYRLVHAQGDLVIYRRVDPGDAL